MRIYKLTQVGYSMASTPPNGELTDARRVCSYLRRHGLMATDEQITSQVFQGDRMAMRLTLNQLLRGSAPPVIELQSK